MSDMVKYRAVTGLSSLGVPGVPWHTQILADQLTLIQPGGGANYAHYITRPSGFSDLPMALISILLNGHDDVIA